MQSAALVGPYHLRRIDERKGSFLTWTVDSKMATATFAAAATPMKKLKSSVEVSSAQLRANVSSRGLPYIVELISQSLGLERRRDRAAFSSRPKAPSRFRPGSVSVVMATSVPTSLPRARM